MAKYTTLKTGLHLAKLPPSFRPNSLRINAFGEVVAATRSQAVNERPAIVIELYKTSKLIMILLCSSSAFISSAGCCPPVERYFRKTL